MQAQNPLKSWFYSIPVFTRTYLVIVLFTGFGSSFGLIDPMTMVFERYAIFKRFQLWRLISNFFYIGGPSMNFVFNLMFIMNFGSSFERNPLSCTKGAAGDGADFLFCVIWGVFLNLIVACIIPNYVLAMPLLQYMIYLWSKQNPNTPRSFWGITIPGFYVPFILMAFSLLMGAPIVDNIIGMVTGHIFYFFSQVYEPTKDSKWFTTPSALRRALSLPPSGKKEQEEERYRRNYGQGHVLGINSTVCCKKIVFKQTTPKTFRK